VLEAQEVLERDYGVAADVWSVTSYKALYRDALIADRHNRLNPGEPPRKPYVYRALEKAKGPLVAASDYMKVLPDVLARYLPRPMVSLGTDGFGRSEARAELRDFFEVDARHVVLATLHALAEDGQVDESDVVKARDALGIRPDKADPYHD
jgi:pyruvate dehydrogenase E1 component